MDLVSQGQTEGEKLFLSDAHQLWELEPFCLNFRAGGLDVGGLEGGDYV